MCAAGMRGRRRVAWARLRQMELTDRVALITGARRIGGAVAAELARLGAHVGLSYNRSQAAAERAAEAVRACGRHAAVIQADLSRPEDCRRLVETTVAELGRLDVLVNMASTYATTSFDDLTVVDWERVMAVDLTSAFLCAHASAPHLRKAGAGRIINFADWVAASHRPRYRGYLPYYVAKAGVIGLTEALALELAGDGILVNAIAPGPILQPDDLDADAARRVEQETPLGRWGGSAEIVKVVVGLIESDFITGETVRVDGGRHVR